MPNYHRSRVAGGCYFFTVVTFARQPLFQHEHWRKILGEALRHYQLKWPFQMDAIVLLPDHLHAIWTLPDGEADYSKRWSKIKEHFTRRYLNEGGTEGQRSNSRVEHRQRAVWQHRFWEHTIIDDNDFKRCLDYIHWNPVKHGFVQRPVEYPHSSFKKYVEMGEYPLEWGDAECGNKLVGAEWD